MKKKIILIHGIPGSGKTSTAKLIADHLEYEHFSGGKFFRDEAGDRGVTFKELHKMIENNYSIDITLDTRQKEYLQNNERIVGDSRLGFFFQPKAFKVLLSLDHESGAKRIYNDMNTNIDRKTEIVDTWKMVLENFIEREEKNAERYKKLYGIENYLDENNFDIIVDTKKNNLEEVAKIVIREYKKWTSDI